MNKRALLASIVSGTILSLSATSVLATSNYVYESDEYVTITRGRAPDRVCSISAHGEGDIGADNFNLYLIDAKTGKRLRA